MSSFVSGRVALASALGLMCAAAIAACGSSSATDDTTSSRATTTVTRTETDRSTTGPASTASSSSSTATSSTAGASSTSSGATTHACTAADLVLRFLGGEGATGHGELGFSLGNTTGTPCRTYGYPGIQFLAQDGSRLPTVPTHTTSDFFGHTTEQAVTIAPGESASFRLGVTHVASDGGGCTTAHRLQVIPPDDTATLTVDLPSGGAVECGGRATVSPVQPGSAAFAH